jgi:hypothetical protein
LMMMFQLLSLWRLCIFFCTNPVSENCCTMWRDSWNLSPLMSFFLEKCMSHND